MIHGELFDLAGSRNAASTTRHTPGQDRTGGGWTLAMKTVSRRHGLRLTNRGAALLIAVSAVFFLVCTYIGLGQ